MTSPINAYSKSNTSLLINITWADPSPSKGPMGLTFGDVSLHIDNHLIWGSLDDQGKISGIKWNLIELLEFLANSWAYLNENECLPATPPKYPNYLTLNQIWKISRENWPVEYDEDHYDFLIVHDFSEAFHGLNAPRFALLRRGDKMIAADKSSEWELDFNESIAMLTKTGDNICQRIQNLTDQRSKLTVKRWTERCSIRSPIQQLQIATGISDPKILKEVIAASATAANDQIYHIKAAARMLRDQPALINQEFLTTIINHLQKGSLPKIPNLPTTFLETQNPTEQGYAIAAELRKHLDLKDDHVDPEKVLVEWGVPIKYEDLSSNLIDAIAIWGPNYTPTIIVNYSGVRVRRPGGKQSTLAHEICHLLVDMHAGLPALDVLGGQVSTYIERRADAFAADFLLPRRTVKSILTERLASNDTQDHRNKTLGEILILLTVKYNVSYELASWQIINSRHEHIDSYSKNYLRRHTKSQRKN